MQENPPAPQTPERPTPAAPAAGFYSARAASLLQSQPLAADSAPAPVQFNPHADSPSIRKTSGVDHTKSKPVVRESIGLPSAGMRSVVPAGMAVIGDALGGARRVGMPPSPAPMNRGSYKPPAMIKRPLEANSAAGGEAAKRIPLGELPPAERNKAIGATTMVGLKDEKMNAVLANAGDANGEGGEGAKRVKLGS